MISNIAINAVKVCVLLASQAPSGYTSMNALIAQLGLSASNLENILKFLRQHDLILSSKGPGGGFMIKGSACSISIWDVVTVFQKTLVDTGPPHTLRPHESYILALEEVVMTQLKRWMISDFVDPASTPNLSPSTSSGRFNFKPLPAPVIPKVPNSVFQWHLSL
jgi:Rrf2 family protein